MTDVAIGKLEESKEWRFIKAWLAGIDLDARDDKIAQCGAKSLKSLAKAWAKLWNMDMNIDGEKGGKLDMRDQQAVLQFRTTCAIKALEKLNGYPLHTVSVRMDSLTNRMSKSTSTCSAVRTPCCGRYGLML